MVVLHLRVTNLATLLVDDLVGLEVRITGRMEDFRLTNPCVALKKKTMSNWFVCLSACLSVCLFVCLLRLSVCLSFCPLVCLFVYLFMYWSVYWSLCLLDCLPL